MNWIGKISGFYFFFLKSSTCIELLNVPIGLGFSEFFIYIYIFFYLNISYDDKVWWFLKGQKELERYYLTLWLLKGF